MKEIVIIVAAQNVVNFINKSHFSFGIIYTCFILAQSLDVNILFLCTGSFCINLLLR